MIKIVFEFESQIISIQGNVSESFKIIINKFSQKTFLDTNEMEFYVNGQVIDPEKTVDNYLKKSNGNRLSRWKRSSFSSTVNLTNRPPIPREHRTRCGKKAKRYDT